MTFEQIRERLQKDPRNESYVKRGISPLWQVSSQAKILLIGQAPGKKAEESQTLFHDLSGNKLMSWMGIDPTFFYSQEIAILPMDFYYPGKGKTGDLPPRSFIAKEYHPYFFSLMPLVQLTVLIGRYSVDYYLKNKRHNLTETVRHYEDYLPSFFPLVHPSPLNFRWQTKNPWFEQEVVPVLQSYVKKILG